MLELTMKDLAKILGGCYQGAADVFPKGVAIDSRRVKKGDLFFALKGEKSDGHLFVDAALENGAVGAVISDVEKVENPKSKNIIICEDPQRFLQALAKLVRQNLRLPVIAVTGSTGKTSTKDMIFSILEQRYKTLKTQGNYNNELGLPLTLCAIDKSHEALVLEMGMRGLGQISFLCQLAQPTHGVITNIGHVHAELLGSQEKIAQAKAELLEFLPKEGTVLLNIEDRSLLSPWLKNCRAEILWFGINDAADIYATDIIFKGEEGCRFMVHFAGQVQEMEVNLPGQHNVLNALSAIGIARSLGVDWSQIRKGLAAVKLSAMRLQVENTVQGAQIINDTYNANPDSMAAAVKVLANSKGARKIAVLGDMYELGIYETEGHKSIGKLVYDEKIDLLVAVGKLGRLIGLGALEAGMPEEAVVFHGENAEALAFLKGQIRTGDTILVKGSRGMRMETIVEGLMR